MRCLSSMIWLLWHAAHEVAEASKTVCAWLPSAAWRAGELLIMRHSREVRLVNAPAIVGESVLLNLLPDEGHVRPITLRAIAPCVLWVLTIKDLEHIFQVRLWSFCGSCTDAHLDSLTDKAGLAGAAASCWADGRTAGF